MIKKSVGVLSFQRLFIHFTFRSVFYLADGKHLIKLVAKLRLRVNRRRFLHSGQEVHFSYIYVSFLQVFSAEQTGGLRFSSVHFPGSSGSDDQNLTVVLQVDALSVPQDEENPESCGVYQRDDGKHVTPRLSDLDQVTRQRHDQNSCTTE